MPGKPLSQVETIRSLGEALAWFQRELSWGVQPAALSHLTGRIGELYAAVTLNGEMATAVHQRGYDIMVGKDTNERISVKTVTSSTHVTFRSSTFDQVDRILVLKIDVDDDDITIKTIINEAVRDIDKFCSKDAQGNYIFMVRDRAPIRPTKDLDVQDHATYGGFAIKRYANGTIIVEKDGVTITPTKPILREIAAKIGVNIVNSNDNPRNTRQLGAEIIAALRARSEPSTTVPGGLQDT